MPEVSRGSGAFVSPARPSCPSRSPSPAARGSEPRPIDSGRGPRTEPFRGFGSTAGSFLRRDTCKRGRTARLPVRAHDHESSDLPHASSRSDLRSKEAASVYSFLSKGSFHPGMSLLFAVPIAMTLAGLLFVWVGRHEWNELHRSRVRQRPPRLRREPAGRSRGRSGGRRCSTSSPPWGSRIGQRWSSGGRSLRWFSERS